MEWRYHVLGVERSGLILGLWVEWKTDPVGRPSRHGDVPWSLSLIPPRSI